MKRYFLKVHAIDNRLTVDINGNTFFDASQHSDPLLHIERDITDLLQDRMVNRVLVRGYNGDFLPPKPSGNNAWHFSYQIVRRDFMDSSTYTDVDVVPPVNRNGESAPSNWVFEAIYQLVKSGDTFVLQKDGTNIID